MDLGPMVPLKPQAPKNHREQPVGTMGRDAMLNFLQGGSFRGSLGGNQQEVLSTPDLFTDIGVLAGWAQFHVQSWVLRGLQSSPVRGMTGR